MTRQANNRTVVWSRIRRGGLTFLAAIPVLVIPTFEWLPGIPTVWRRGIILTSLALGAAGFVIVTRNERNLEKLAEENAQMLAKIDLAAPEYLLRQIASTIFREGAWRLTVYRKAHAPLPGPGDHLVKLASVASDGDQGGSSARIIHIRPKTMFEHSFQTNLADARYRQATPSGPGPDDVHTDAWKIWRDGIFGANAIIDDTSTFRARKIAWYAAQDPESQIVFVSIAESADPEGISVELLDLPMTPAWLFSVPRLAELRDVSALKKKTQPD